eukprot:TsM_000248600 transcript=TsM_000248600 gene=TsM_000248600
MERSGILENWTALDYSRARVRLERRGGAWSDAFFEAIAAYGLFTLWCLRMLPLCCRWHP